MNNYKQFSMFSMFVPCEFFELNTRTVCACRTQLSVCETEVLSLRKGSEESRLLAFPSQTHPASSTSTNSKQCGILQISCDTRALVTVKTLRWVYKVFPGASRLTDWGTVTHCSVSVRTNRPCVQLDKLTRNEHGEFANCL